MTTAEMTPETRKAIEDLTGEDWRVLNDAIKHYRQSRQKIIDKRWRQGIDLREQMTDAMNLLESVEVKVRRVLRGGR